MGEPAYRVYRANDLEAVAEEWSDQRRRRALHGMPQTSEITTTQGYLADLEIAAEIRGSRAEPDRDGRRYRVSSRAAKPEQLEFGGEELL